MVSVPLLTMIAERFSDVVDNVDVSGNTLVSVDKMHVFVTVAIAA